MTTYQPALPGITPPSGEPTSLTKAALATVEALEVDGLLEPRHAATVQLVLSLAGQIDGATAHGAKITVALANTMRLLLDALAALPMPEATQSDEWAELAAAFAKADRDARAAAEAARA